MGVLRSEFSEAGFAGGAFRAAIVKKNFNAVEVKTSNEKVNQLVNASGCVF